jgi:hypothetical protein
MQTEIKVGSEGLWGEKKYWRERRKTILYQEEKKLLIVT